MDHAVLAEGGSGFFLITDCTFENYPDHEAVFISNRPSLNITNSTWEGDIGSVGLDLQRVTQVVMRNSNLNGHASPGAVNLDGVSYFIMRNSGMSDNNIGINTTFSYLGGSTGIDFAPSNVFMLDGSFIQNGETGIEMLGDATVGLVLMDCSSLLNNDVGVSGTDIVLMIDAINAQQHPLDGNEPNSFLRYGWGPNTDQYFDICYEQKSPGQPIPMRKNWWAVNDIGTRQFDPEDFMDIRHNNCSVQTLVDVTQALDRAPNDCIPDEFAGPTYPGAGTEAECNVSVSGEASVLGEVWHTAYQQLRLENFEAAEAGFQPIADLWSADLSSYSTNCRQYIQVARAIVDGAGQGSAPRSKEQANNVRPAVSINPNPSAGLVNIALPEVICKIRIWDTYGKLVHETSASNLYRLEVTDWPSGLYWLDVSTPDGRFREQVKMVVQR
jgi:hypothetical protein